MPLTYCVRCAGKRAGVPIQKRGLGHRKYLQGILSPLLNAQAFADNMKYITYIDRYVPAGLAAGGL